MRSVQRDNIDYELGREKYCNDSLCLDGDIIYSSHLGLHTYILAVSTRSISILLFPTLPVGSVEKNSRKLMHYLEL